jgi:hypothetical protein
MSLDFFQDGCQEAPINHLEFGLCDDENGKKAYTDLVDRGKWIATVKNDNGYEIVFTAVDKCVLFDHEYIGRGRCDGMLTTQKHLYLVELKDQKTHWQSNAINQLESTIRFLQDNHDLSQYKLRKAFASNRRREKFVVIDNETNKRFYKRTTFRLDLHAEIVIL